MQGTHLLARLSLADCALHDLSAAAPARWSTRRCGAPVTTTPPAAPVATETLDTIAN
jgi:hypothetical protein